MFVNSISKILAVFLTIAILLTGCWLVKENARSSITSPGLSSQDLTPLDASNILKISELKQLVANEASGAVAIADYFPAKNVLITVNTGDGFLRAWDIDDDTVLFERDLGIASSVGLGFTESGDLVMGAMLHEIRENDFGELEEYVGGVVIWNIDTGEIVDCVVYPCDKSASDWQRDGVSGVVLDPKGRWVIINYELGISVSDIADVITPYSFSTGRPGNLKRVARIAFDFSSDRYALAIREGEIIIEEIGKEIVWFPRKIHLGTYREGERHDIKALGFSPNGEWLARIQDNILIVWKIDTHRGKFHFEKSIPNGRLLAFDRLSELLFVGTNDAIQIWNIKEMEFIGEYATPDITSLSISADNRLLIWGDQFGIVHIWGIR